MQLDFCPHCFEATNEAICPRCGFTIGEYETPEKALKPGTIIGRNYKIGRVLGIGGFGITYTGYDLRVNARYAIKEYLPNTVARRGANGALEIIDPSDKEIYDQGLAMFLEETNILITLTQCPNIVQAFDFVHENKTGYLIMEFLDGVNLKSILRERGTIDTEFGLKVLLKVADALRSVHAKGLLHRDISPENVMVMKDESIKLIDFGAARFYVGSKNKDTTLILKPGFAPPEQYSTDGNQGEWTDIYALAATYYKIITGNTLPDARTRQIHDTVERLDNLYTDIPSHVGFTIHQALSLDYRQRPQSVDRFVDDLLGNNLYSQQPDEPTNAYIAQQPTENLAANPSQKIKSWWSSVKKKTQDFVSELEVNPFQSEDYGGGVPAGVITGAHPYVRVVSGAINLGQWSIPTDREMSVGRDFNSCDLVVYGNSISRKHCTVSYSSDRNCFFVTDYSSNGTYLSDGTRLQPGTLYALEPGSVVLLSSQEYIMEVGVKE